MKGRNFYSYLFIWLCISGLTAPGFSQTITTGSFTPTTVCPGGTTTITFTISETFAANNTFSAQLSDAAGTFPASPIVIGSIVSATAVAIGGTIPASTANGSYKIRVVSSNPARTGSTSSQSLTINVPPAPGTSSLSYCVGQSAAALTATAASGATLNWYGTAATGGTASVVSPTPSTTSVSTTTYYVSQSVNGCESPRASILVTVTNAPAAPTVTVPAPYCQAVMATPLTANGQALKWYDASNNLLNGAPTPNTSSPGTTTYYVSQSNGSCESPRAAIAVTVNSIPNSPSVAPANFCQNSTASPLTATPVAGGILNWYGTNATGGTSSPTAPAPPTNTTGTITYYVSQSVNGCEGPRTSLTVTINALPAAPAATPPAPYCQGASAAPLVATGQGLKWYGTNATGGTANAATPTPGTGADGTTNYYVSQTTNGCESARTAIPVVVKPKPAAPGTSAIAFCQGSPSPTLTATFAPNATPNWYGTNPTSGTATTTAPTPSNTLAGTTVYYVSQTLDGCESDRASVNVRVKPLPSAPGVTPIGFCNNGPASQLNASGENLRWYDGSGTFLSGGAPTPGTGAVGNQTFKVSQTVEGCEGSKADLIVTIKPLPDAPGVTNLSYCLQTQDQPGQNIAALTANGQQLRWFNTDGNQYPIAPTPFIDKVGVQTYQVNQTINGCTGAKATLQVTVRTTAAPTVSKPSVTYCLNDKAVPLEATAESGGSLRWVDPYGNVSNTALTPSTLNTSIQAGGDPFYVFQIGQNGCYSPRTSVLVTVNPKPNAPSVAPINFCQNKSATQLVAIASSGGTLNWYGTASTGGASSTTAPTPPTNATGITTYYVSQSVNGCESDRAGLNVTVNATPSSPIGIIPNPYCQFANPTSLSASGQNLKWYGTNQNGGTDSNTAPVPNTDVPGSNTYYVTQTINGCESLRTGIVVTVKPKPGQPGTSTIAFCQGSPSPTLNATFVSSSTPNWYGKNQTGGSASTTAPTPPNTPADTTFYYVSQTVDGCESDRASLMVRVKPLPSVPSVTSISFCNNSPASQLTAVGTELKWYDASEKLLGGAPTPGTGTVGDQIFKVSQTVESCEGPKANLVVTIKPLPDAPGVTNLSYCFQTQDQPGQNIAALTANGQQLRWFNPDGNQYPIAPTPFIDKVGVQTYQVNQTVNGCTGAKATIQVTVRTTAEPTVAKSLVTYCINDKPVPLEATAESGGSLRWVDPYGNVSNTALTPSTLNTSVQAGGDPFYAFQIGQNGCYSARSTIKVLVNAQPTLSLLTPVTNINLGQRATLQLKFTSVAPFSYTLTNGLSGVVNRNDTTLSVLPRTTTTYQIVTVRNSCGVGLPGNPATATITVRVPTVTTSALTASTLCTGTSLTVPFATTGEFNPGNAFGIELVSVADTTKKYAVPTNATASPVTAPIPTTLVSGQYYVRVKADNPEIAVTGSNSPTLLTVRSQPTATLAGTQNIYEGYPANLTLTFGGESPWTVEYADSVRSYSATATTSPYAIEVRPSRSTTYRLVSVINGCGNGPVSGTATVTVLPLLAVEDDPLDPLVKTYPVPTTSIVTVELDLPLTRNPATLSVSDLSGRSVLQQTTRNRKQELDLTAQPNGLYLLHIQVGDRQTVRKILKQ